MANVVELSSVQQWSKKPTKQHIRYYTMQKDGTDCLSESIINVNASSATICPQSWSISLKKR